MWQETAYVPVSNWVTDAEVQGDAITVIDGTDQAIEHASSYGTSTAWCSNV